jgi:LAGLIDADG endonuclease
MLTLDFHKIPYTFEDHTHKKRGSNVKIAGVNNVKKLMTCFSTSSSSDCDHAGLTAPPMHGLKFLDFLLMEAVYRIIEAKEHNTPKGRLKIIDLKYSLHNPSVVDIIDATHNRLSRSEWEKRHNFNVNASVNAAQSEIIGAHNQYENHKQKIKLINCATYVQNPEYISGIIEGDGCISLGISNLNKSSFPRFTAYFSVVVEDGGQLLLEIVAQYFGDLNPYITRVAKKKAWSYQSHNRKVLKNVYDHCKRYPVLGSEKLIDCLADVLSVWDKNHLLLGSTGRLTLKEATRIATKIYETSPDPTRRKKSLQQVISEIAACYPL